MRYSDLKPIAADSVLILVHIPRTSGTSFRTMVAGMLDPASAYRTYQGEIFDAQPEALQPIRFVAGHLAHGLDRFFDRPCHYISFVRDPFDRFVSLYSVFRTNASSPGHALARKYDINDFLKACLDPANTWHYGQINNLQSRLICGAPDFDTARRFVVERYYAVLPFEEVRNLPRLAKALLGRSPPDMPHVHNTREVRKAFSAVASLSDGSLELLARSEREDILLHSFVRARAAQFADEAAATSSAPGRVERSERRRPLAAPVRSPMASPQRDNCPLCAGAVFAAGPNGRMTPSGLGPCCVRCGSLERHRVVWNLMRLFPAGFLDWRRAIQFSRDGSLRAAWFRSLEFSQYDQGGLDLQAIERPDESFDLVSLNHVLESVPDDRAALRELARVLSSQGMIQVCFGLAEDGADTQEYAEARFDWAAHRRYGKDVMDWLQIDRLGLHLVEVQAPDPCTGEQVRVHLLFKDPEQADLAASWLLASDARLRLLQAGRRPVLPEHGANSARLPI